MNNLKRDYFWNTLGSGLVSFNSLFFLVVVTRLNGVKEAGIFTFCYATACMLYIIATYYGRTYQVTETKKEFGDNEYITHRLFSSTLMIIISLLFAIINGYINLKFIIFILLCSLKCLEALCDVFHGILQKNNRLDIVGKSLFFRSLGEIILFLLSDIVFHNLIICCFSLIIINIIFLLFIDMRFASKYKEKKTKVNFNSVYKLFLLGFFTFGISFIANYLVNAPRYAIDSLLSEELQTIFGIIVMPATIIMLINQFVIQPVINMLKNSYHHNNKNMFLNLINKIIGITIITGILCIVVAYFLGIPILNLIYGLKLNNYLYNLLIILLGATIYTVASVLSNSLIILRKTKFQLYIYLITSFIAYVISNYLVSKYKFNGATYGYLIIMLILLIQYIIYFIFVMKDKKTWKKEGFKNEREN